MDVRSSPPCLARAPRLLPRSPARQFYAPKRLHSGGAVSKPQPNSSGDTYAVPIGLRGQGGCGDVLLAPSRGPDQALIDLEVIVSHAGDGEPFLEAPAHASPVEVQHGAE